MTDRLAAAAAAVCVLAGCVEVDGAARCWAVAPTDGGGGAALADGVHLPIVNGPPLWPMTVIGIAAENIDPGNADEPTNPANPQYAATLAQDGWGELASRSGKLGFVRLADGTVELPEVRLVFQWQLPTAGTSCRLRIAVTDRRGNGCNQTLSVVPEKR